TWANQIASLAIFDSPLLTIAANPQSILANAAVDVIRSIPAVWDETIVLPGSEIGELVAYARRTGDTWFLAVMCGPQPRTINVPLSFLGAGDHRTAIVRDPNDNPAAVQTEATARRGESLKIELGAGGGFVARFKKL